MNLLVRRYRRWRYAKRCAECNRKFLFVHRVCKPKAAALAALAKEPK